MTNDLTTVEGSFQQLIDDLENNLQEKGLDAEYDATTGIRGLVAKISEIEPLPSYDIRFETHDVVKYYQDPDKQFFANVYDNGEKVTRTDIHYDDTDSTLKFIINYPDGSSVSYSRRYLDTNNAVKLNLQMPPGEHDIITNYKKDNSIFAATNHITILPRLTSITGDLTKYFRNAQYSVKYVDFNGEPVSGQEIIYWLNDASYSRTTNTEGISKININLYPGEYIITAGVGNEKISNKIIILSPIISEDVTFNQGQQNQYIVTVLDRETGEPSPNKTVTFQINSGSIITQTSDSNGQAVLTLSANANVGTYTIKTTYENYTQTNTITIVESSEQ